MPRADLIIHGASQLLTCHADRPKRRGEMNDCGVLNGAAIAISDGVVAAVGSAEEIFESFDAAETIDVAGRTIVPGFVDPHSHIVFAGDRLDEFEKKIRGVEYLEILAAGGGILSTVRNTRSAGVEELVAASTVRLDRMLACGTTTCEVKTGYGLDTENELKMFAVIEKLDRTHAVDIVPTFLPAHTIPPEFKNDAAGYVSLICDVMLPLAWKMYSQSHFVAKGTPFFCDVFTEQNAFDVESTKRIFAAAKALGFKLKAHVDQFNNLGGSSLAIESGAVSIDHLDAISDAEVSQLAASGTIGVVIPTENFSGGKTKFADARKLIDSGCAVAVSTDYNPGSAPCPSLPMAMAIACRYQKLTPAEALNAVTINSAYAAGVGERCGSLSVGKAADLCVFDASGWRSLAYEFGYSHKVSVFKAGRMVYDSK